jgi:hypothetical protein
MDSLMQTIITIPHYRHYYDTEPNGKIHPNHPDHCRVASAGARCSFPSSIGENIVAIARVLYAEDPLQTHRDKDRIDRAYARICVPYLTTFSLPSRSFIPASSPRREHSKEPIYQSVSGTHIHAGCGYAYRASLGIRASARSPCQKIPLLHTPYILPCVTYTVLQYHACSLTTYPTCSAQTHILLMQEQAVCLTEILSFF